MKILLAASELSPFARTGPVGDVLENLPAALLARGHEVSVVIPCYRGLRDDARLGASATGVRIQVPLGDETLEVEILQGRTPKGVQIFLVRRDESFDRVGLYGMAGRDFPDTAQRFILFSKSVVELARRIIPGIDLIHVHDWQAALVPALVKARRLPFKTVLTIHDVTRQGAFPAEDFALTNLPSGWFSPSGLEFYGGLNLLKSGILFADAVTAVSQSHLREIQTPAGGAKLDAVLREHAPKLTAVLNGIDNPAWHPATDKLLPKTYKATALAGKKACRAELLAQLGLAPGAKGPLFSVITRTGDGLELLLPIIDRLLSTDARLVIIGPGGPAHERDLLIATRRHRERFAHRLNVEEPLAHLVQAGADLTFLLGKPEPSGLSALRSLQYGTLPIARDFDSLSQLVQDYDPRTDSGTGFVFNRSASQAVWDTAKRVQKLFADAPVWKRLVQRAMTADSSWSKAVVAYEEVFARTLGIPESARDSRDVVTV